MTSARLHALGYAQELARRLGRVLELRDLAVDHLHPGRRGDLVSPRALQRGRRIDRPGLAAGALFSLVVAATMGQLASTFPTAGGLYHWASILGGRGWGWATAWFNLAGLVTVLAAINVGTYRFALGAFGPPAGTLSAGATTCCKRPWSSRSPRPRRRSIIWGSASRLV